MPLDTRTSSQQVSFISYANDLIRQLCLKCSYMLYHYTFLVGLDREQNIKGIVMHMATELTTLNKKKPLERASFNIEQNSFVRSL